MSSDVHESVVSEMAQKRATTGTGKAYSNRPARGTGPSIGSKRVATRPKKGTTMYKDTKANRVGAEGPKKSMPRKKAR